MSGDSVTRPFGNGFLHLMQGDLTEMTTDAIVNAANKHLILGGGVAGAIRAKGGPAIQEECDRIGGTHVGGAVITGAGMLKAAYVIHAVGPVMGEGDEDNKLKRAVQNSLKRAEENQLQSIAFPAISTGIFGYPMERCARIMISQIRDYLQTETRLKDIYICLWDRKAFDVFVNALPA